MLRIRHAVLLLAFSSSSLAQDQNIDTVLFRLADAVKADVGSSSMCIGPEQRWREKLPSGSTFVRAMQLLAPGKPDAVRKGLDTGLAKASFKAGTKWATFAGNAVPTRWRTLTNGRTSKLVYYVAAASANDVDPNMTALCFTVVRQGR